MIYTYLLNVKCSKLFPKSRVIFIIGFLFFTSCTPGLDVPEPNPGNAVFEKTIAIGGNYMAGYQDGALFLKGQKYSIGSLIAKQLELVGAGHFHQSMMPDDDGLGLNLFPWKGRFVKALSLRHKTDCMGLTMLSPVGDTISLGNAVPYLTGVAGNGIQNFAVPFATLPDYFDPAFGNSSSYGNPNPYYNRLASNPGVSTLYEDAKAQYLTFLIAWVGMEDIYNYAAKGATGSGIPSSVSFSASLDILLKGLTDEGENKGVIANIPRLESFPYYTSVKWNDLQLTQIQADSLNNHYHTVLNLPQINFMAGKNGFVIEDPMVTGGYRQLHGGEYVTLSVPADSIKCFGYGLLPNPVPDFYVLDSLEIMEINQAVHLYNAVIAFKASQYNLAFVDMNAYFNAVESGIKWNGSNLNSEFITGGFFSLDGYHPNQKGYVLIANEFIKSINNKYNAVIPTVNCMECNGILFP